MIIDTNHWNNDYQVNGYQACGFLMRIFEMGEFTVRDLSSGKLELCANWTVTSFTPW